MPRAARTATAGHARRPARRRRRRASGTAEAKDRRRLQTSEGLRVKVLTGMTKNYPFVELWTHHIFTGALLYTFGR